MGKTKTAPGSAAPSILAIAILAGAALAALLGTGCNVSFTSFLTGGKPPPGPPSKAERPRQSNTAAARKPASPAAANRPPVERAAAEKPSPAGPRLSAMLARDELGKLVASRIVFDASEQMRAGVKEKVEVRLAENLYEDFAKGLKDLGMDQEFEIASGSSVKAALAGEGFDIRPAAEGEEPARSGVFAPWTWHVTPLKSGVQPLLLTVTVAIRVPGGADEKKDLPVITRAVTVSASPGYAASRFLQSGWQWIAGLLAVLFAGWLIWRQQS
ncbi:MAG TPA: hypothetical protein VGA73_07360 [Candidatus Binatia bacterium]